MRFIEKLLKKEQKNIEVYQLEFVEFTKIEHGYDYKVTDHQKHLTFPKFKRPEGMTEEEMYKVLSYMYQWIHAVRLDKIDAHVVPENIVTPEEIVLNMATCLEDFHFKVLGYTEDECKTLYVLDGNTKLAKEFARKQKVTKWRRDFTIEEVNEIYNNLDLEMPKIKISNKVTYQETNC